MKRITSGMLKGVGYGFFLAGLVVSKFHLPSGYILLGIMAVLWIGSGILETVETYKGSAIG